MLYENLVSASFSSKVKQIAKELQINPDWLMMVMYNESHFNPAATNSIGAVGLIQFVPSTYQAWGFSKSQMQNMSALDQLDLVKRFYWNARGKFTSYPDLHLFAFFPAALGKPDNWVLQTSNLSAQTVVTHNPGFDLNNDGKITVGEYKQKVYDRTVGRVGKKMADILFSKSIFNNSYWWIGGIILFIIIGVIIYLKRASIKKWMEKVFW